MTTPVLPAQCRWPLHDTAASRRIEQAALSASADHALMARAGLAVARLALAVAPHADEVWAAVGPGNNGGDGLVAARHLLQAGRRVRVSLVGHTRTPPTDAANALDQAQQAGVRIEPGLPGRLGATLVIDALLGIGARQAPRDELAQAIARINAQGAPVLSIDLPSGLSADTGTLLGEQAVRASHTLSLLTLKPGLFTAQGRDHSGRVWFDELGVDHADEVPTAWLIGPAPAARRAHVQHKGSFGDVIVIGGASGMGGAAVLAARAALTSGAGRVYLARLDGDMSVDTWRPEVMPRPLKSALSPAALQSATVVCGCGGGVRVHEVLPTVLHHAARLVLDADALNAVTQDGGLTNALRARADRGLPTVLTPHPLEAARLLGATSTGVQSDRLAAASRLAGQTGSCTVLKGSGTVVTDVAGRPHVNATGNASLATAGTGDVLAGWIGGLWSQDHATQGCEAAQAAVWLHGLAADAGARNGPLRAAELIDRMAQLRP